ncbi:coiled-coil domain-containing protein [Chryseobacterium sp. GP-SGM7]|uniref:coiled-coil domain-containing protein n=1 Tax=Chryseobacterium sp. GP-SGM7 TaxID=3411323 RepID=UPI003B939A93
MNTEESIQKLTQEFEAELKALTNEISKEVSNIQDDSEILQDNETLFKVKNGNYQYNFEWKKVIFDLPIPQFTMKIQKFSFDIPEVTMDLKEICFDWVKTKMVPKKVGEKPETTCKWQVKWRLGIKTKFWDCTTKWTPIIISVPEIIIERKCMSTKIPEVSMKTKEMIFKIPEVTMISKNISFNTLVITSINYNESEEDIENSNQEITKIQQKLNDLTVAYEGKMKYMQTDLINEQFDNAQNEILREVEPVKNNIEKSIEECKGTITELKNNGATEQLKIEEDKLNKLIADLQKILQPYQQTLEMLNEERKKALDEIEKFEDAA